MFGRRVALRWTSLLAVATLVGSACGSGDSGEGASADASECPIGALDDVTEPVELKVWHVKTSLGADALNSQIEAFNASQDKIVVVGQSQGVSFEEIQRKVEQALPDATLPGLVELEDTKTRWVKDSGAFLFAEACIDADPDGAEVYDDLLPIVANSYSIDGEMLPVSFSAYTAGTYYNKDHFAAAGLDPENIPTTLEGLRDAARAIKAAVPSVGAPLALIARSFIVEWWLAGERQPLVNNDNGREALATESEFDNESTAEILTLIKEMQDEGLVDVVADTPGQADHVLAMATQASSMTIDSTVAITTIAGVIEGTIDAERLKEELGVEVPGGGSLQLDLNVGMAPFPGLTEGGQAQVGGGVWYIPNTSPPEVQEAAWEFSKFLNSPENQAEWTIKGSNVPVFTSVIDDPTIQQDWSSTLGGGWQQTAYEQLAGVDPDWPGAIIGPYTETRTVIRKGLERVWLDNEAIDAVTADVDSKATDELVAYADDVDG